jgi:hypothetical protein
MDLSFADNFLVPQVKIGISRRRFDQNLLNLGFEVAVISYCPEHFFIEGVVVFDSEDHPQPLSAELDVLDQHEEVEDIDVEKGVKSVRNCQHPSHV